MYVKSIRDAPLFDHHKYKIMKFTSSVLLLFISLFLHAQEEGNEMFLVEFDEFEVPQQDLIRSLENSTAMPFMAPDLNGKQQFLGDFQNQVVFVYFWNGDCVSCIEHIQSLNLLHEDEADNLKIIGIVDEKKAAAKKLAMERDVHFPTLYNGKMLGEAAYGIELGYPRLFAIDGSGVIQKVIPAKTMKQKEGIYMQLKNLYESIDGK